MLITNITNEQRMGTGIKVIGFGDVHIMPGETKEVPDSVAYTVIGGKREVLSAIRTLANMGQITYTEEEIAPAFSEETKDEPDGNEEINEEAPKARRGGKKAKTE